MRSLWNFLSDPGLHILGIVLLLAYLTFGGRASSMQVWAESPLAFCQTCHVHHIPDEPCDCQRPRKVAHVRP